MICSWRCGSVCRMEAGNEASTARMPDHTIVTFQYGKEVFVTWATMSRPTLYAKVMPQYAIKGKNTRESERMKVRLAEIQNRLAAIWAMSGSRPKRGVRTDC